MSQKIGSEKDNTTEETESESVALPAIKSDEADTPIRRRTRRKMAQIALYGIFAVTLLAFFVVNIEKLKILGEVITWFYIIMGSIVGSYMGFATLDDHWTPKKKK